MTNKPRIRDWNHRGPFPPRGRRATALRERSGDRGDGPGSAVLTSCQDKWHPQPSPHNSPAAICRHHHPFGLICFSEGMLHLGQMFPSVCLLTAKNSKQLFVRPSGPRSSEERLSGFGGRQRADILLWSSPHHLCGRWRDLSPRFPRAGPRFPSQTKSTA